MANKPTTLIVYDYETSGLDWGDLNDLSKPRNEILQIGAVAYDYDSLEPIPGGEFCSLLKPLFWEKLDPGAMKVNGIKREDLEKAPGQKEVWLSFVSWVNGFNPSKSQKLAPYKAGKNQRAFDTNFTSVMNKLYCKGDKTLMFNNRLDFDLEDEVLRWDLPTRMDDLRVYLGMPVHAYHDALVDAKEEAAVLIKFLGLYRWLKDWRNKDTGKLRIPLEGCFRRAS